MKLILLVCVIALAQCQYTWIQDSDLLEPEHYAAAIQYNEYIYKFFGVTSSPHNNVFRCSMTASATCDHVPTTNAPIPRYAGIVASHGEYIYYYGGMQSGDTNVMYKLHMTSLAWTAVNVTGTIPLAVALPGSAQSSDKWYMYGGLALNSTETNDLFEFSFDNSTFTLLPAVGEVPAVGYYSSLILYNDDLIMFSPISVKGGNMPVDELHRYSLISHSWSPSEVVPTALSGSCSVLINNYIYAFGGYPPNNNFRRMHVTTGTWQSLYLGGVVLQPRYATACVNANNVMWMSGGANDYGKFNQTLHIALDNLTCVVLDRPVGYTLNCTGDKYNDNCIVSCDADAGYFGNTSSVECQANLTWTDMSLGCVRNCTAQDIIHSYTDCVGGSRNATYTLPSSCVHVISLPETVTDLPCGLTCDQGEYLVFATTECRLCEAGTYTIGDELAITNWANFASLGFTTYCTRGDCNSWTSVVPSFITSGDNTNVNSMSSVLQLNVTVARDSSVSFFYKVDCEVGYDFLDFYVDDVSKLHSSGVVEYTFVTYNLTAGYHRLVWNYTKDRYVAEGSDRAYLLNVTVSGVDDSECSVCPPHTCSEAGASICTPCCGEYVPSAGYTDVNCTGTNVGDACTFTCDVDNGYIGQSGEIVCDYDGYWTTSNNCHRYCPSYVAPTGYINTTDCSNVESGNYCPLKCANGFIGAASASYCNSNSSWSAATGCHEPNKCAAPVLPAGYTTTINCTSILYGGVCNLECSSSYIGTADNLTCNEGVWTAPHGCRLTDRCESYVPPYGYRIDFDVNACTNTSYYTECSVRCDYGFNGTALPAYCLPSGWIEPTGCSVINSNVSEEPVSENGDDETSSSFVVITGSTIAVAAIAGVIIFVLKRENAGKVEPDASISLSELVPSEQAQTTSPVTESFAPSQSETVTST